VTRELTADERVFLETALSLATDERFEAPGERAELLAQVAAARHAGGTCKCGCPSFALVVDRSISPLTGRPSGGMPLDEEATSPEGALAGVILHLEAGYLSELELYPVVEASNFSLPDPETIRRVEVTRF
jgi:hypothetical protein